MAEHKNPLLSPMMIPKEGCSFQIGAGPQDSQNGEGEYIIVSFLAPFTVMDSNYVPGEGKVYWRKDKEKPVAAAAGLMQALDKAGLYEGSLVTVSRNFEGAFEVSAFDGSAPRQTTAQAIETTPPMPHPPPTMPGLPAARQPLTPTSLEQTGIACGLTVERVLGALEWAVSDESKLSFLQTLIHKITDARNSCPTLVETDEDINF